MRFKFLKTEQENTDSERSLPVNNPHIFSRISPMISNRFFIRFPEELSILSNCVQSINISEITDSNPIFIITFLLTEEQRILPILTNYLLSGEKINMTIEINEIPFIFIEGCLFTSVEIPTLSYQENIRVLTTSLTISPDRYEFL